ncbi:MAG: biopolymer transporter ExbD, partial [Planctomycetia bacterium]|nr:biopolymer transporter ExbD [Planctomycetia bacterium]
MSVKIDKGFALDNLTMTPLIDVVFNLLIFFLVAPGLAEAERELDVMLPEASEARPLTSKPHEMFINIDRDGRYYVTRTAINLAELDQVLKTAWANNQGHQTVVIRADKRCRWEFVVAAMNACNKAHIHDYRVTTRENTEAQGRATHWPLTTDNQSMPGTSKQVVRKVRSGRVADFDDQMWPVNCAILILAGFATGISIATGDWYAENLLYNTVFRLVLVAVAVAVAFVAMIRLQRKMIRRVQLCVLVSLLLHVWLGLVLHQRYIALVMARQEAEAARRLVEEDPRLIVPEYHWENIEQPESRHTFEEPVATEAPKATEPEPLMPKQLEHDVPADKKPRTEPSPPHPQQPNPAEVRRAELTAPRRAPLAAGTQISRQEWKHLLEPNEPIPEPEAPPRVEDVAAQPAAAAAHQPRRGDAPRHEREMFESAPAAMAKQDAMKLARRAAPSEPLPDAPTTPTPTRELARPADVAQTEIAASPPAAPVAMSPARLTPAPSELAARATAAAPEPSPGRELPAMTPASQLPASVARRAEASLSEPSPERSDASLPSTLA